MKISEFIKKNRGRLPFKLGIAFAVYSFLGILGLLIGLGQRHYLAPVEGFLFILLAPAIYLIGFYTMLFCYEEGIYTVCLGGPVAFPLALITLIAVGVGLGLLIERYMRTSSGSAKISKTESMRKESK